MISFEHFEKIVAKFSIISEMKLIYNLYGYHEFYMGHDYNFDHTSCIYHVHDITLWSI